MNQSGSLQAFRGAACALLRGCALATRASSSSLNARIETPEACDKALMRGLCRHARSCGIAKLTRVRKPEYSLPLGVGAS
jgi:hypothetical protein